MSQLGHNEINQILSPTPKQFEPMHWRKANGIRAPGIRDCQ
jgi:hypothetical protein